MAWLVGALGNSPCPLSFDALPTRHISSPCPRARAGCPVGGCDRALTLVSGALTLTGHQRRTAQADALLQHQLAPHSPVLGLALLSSPCRPCRHTDGFGQRRKVSGWCWGKQLVSCAEARTVLCRAARDGAGWKPLLIAGKCICEPGTGMVTPQQVTLPAAALHEDPGVRPSPECMAHLELTPQKGHFLAKALCRHP